MEDLINQFDNLSIDMEKYYVKDFLEFYKGFGFSQTQALNKAKQAAKEQIAIDIEAIKKARKAELRKRTIAWLKIAQSQHLEKRVLEALSTLVEKLSL